MAIGTIFKRSLKWRIQNPITIIMSILQPMLWLLFYTKAAEMTMKEKIGGSYIEFILPGILVLVIFSSSGSSGISNYITRKNGSFYRILISPIKRSDIILGHLFETISVSFLEISILTAISAFFSIYINSGIKGMAVVVFLLFLTTFLTAEISYFLSLCLPNEDVFFTVINTLVLPIFFISTALFPLKSMTGIFRKIVLLNPFTHMIESIRNILLNDYICWEEVIFTGGIFLVLCGIVFLIALSKLKKAKKV